MNTTALQHGSRSHSSFPSVVEDGPSYNVIDAIHLPLRRFLLTWIESDRTNDTLSERHVVSVTPADAVLDFCRSFDCGTVELPLETHDAEWYGPNLVRVWTGTVGSARVVVREVIDIAAKLYEQSGTAA